MEDIFERTQLSVRKRKTQSKPNSFVKKQSLKTGRPVGRPKANKNAEETAPKKQKNNEVENAVVAPTIKTEQKQNSEVKPIIKFSETGVITDEETLRVKTEGNINVRQPKRETVESAKDSGELLL